MLIGTKPFLLVSSTGANTACFAHIVTNRMVIVDTMTKHYVAIRNQWVHILESTSNPWDLLINAASVDHKDLSYTDPSTCCPYFISGSLLDSS